MSSTDEDDLDVPRLKYENASTRLQSGKQAESRHEITEDLSRSSSVESVDDLEIRNAKIRSKKRSTAAVEDPQREGWSDEGGLEVGEAAYKKFASRKSTSRKAVAASTRKARAIEAERNPPPRRNGETTGVGRQIQKRKRQKPKAFDDPTSDEDLLDRTIPDYVRDRRSRFDERKEKLKESGLQLPPEYEDLYFSDDARLESLTEKPDFAPERAQASYKDVELPYSLGIIPAPIAQFLRDYQVKGVAFLHELFVYQKGGILGDDMGLGKTVQVIAFLTAAYGKTSDERDKKRMRKIRKVKGRWYPRTLIVCPGSLMANWQDELQRWGWWHSEVYHGSGKQKEEVLEMAQAGRLEIMITTYTTYRLNKSAINMISWDCVVADECHIIKERKSEVTKAMNEINALCRIGLTGTAIQNKYEELWTLLNWTNPGRFGPLTDWRISICEPLKIGQSHNATQYQLSRGRKTARKLVENLLPQIFLRRMKTLIQDQLPKKTDKVIFCPLTEGQADAYVSFLESDMVQTIKNSSEICTCGSGKKQGWCHNMFLEDGTPWQNWVFPVINHLKTISNHLALLIPQNSDPQEKQAKDLDILQLAVPAEWKKLYDSRDSILNYANPEFCGKWRVLKKLLQFWHEGDGNKVLVFSHSVRLLKMLKSLFVHTSYNVSYLDGSMDYEQRYATVQDFNSDPSQFVFLISTRAGGVGLNITSANKVVVVDPNWNPAYDLQAQDRAYRIGQTRDVEVFRLISAGTIEEVVYARQIYKQQQANIGYNASYERRYFQGVQGRKDEKGEIFGLKNLFAYQDENVILQDIVNKTNVAESRLGVSVCNLEVDDSQEARDSDDVKNEEEFEQAVKREPDTEDAAMSQLAAEIIGEADSSNLQSKSTNASFSSGRSKSHAPNAIQHILSSVGVSYAHDNSEVIGSSKVEAKLSKQAEQAMEDGWSGTQQDVKVFRDESQNQNQYRNVYEDPADGKVKAYRYRPPEAVKRRQFCSMAKWVGYEDVVEFALVVESWTQEERRDCLDKFYQWRRDVLEGPVKDESKIANAVRSDEVKTGRGMKGDLDSDSKEHVGSPSHQHMTAVKIEVSDDDDDEL